MVPAGRNGLASLRGESLETEEGVGELCLSGLGVKTHTTERAALVNNDALSSFRRYLLLRRKDARQMVRSVYFPNHLVRTLQVVSVLEVRV